jgi:hypothetical protein
VIALLQNNKYKMLWHYLFVPLYLEQKTLWFGEISTQAGDWFLQLSPLRVQRSEK